MAFGIVSRRGASQPATDGSQTAGASRAPSGASLVEGHLTKHRAFESTVAKKRSFAIIIIAIISNAASKTGSALAKGFYVRSDRSVLAQARRGGEPHLGEWRPRAVLLEEMDQARLTAA